MIAPFSLLPTGGLSSSLFLPFSASVADRATALRLWPGALTLVCDSEYCDAKPSCHGRTSSVLEEICVDRRIPLILLILGTYLSGRTKSGSSSGCFSRRLPETRRTSSPRNESRTIE